MDKRGKTFRWLPYVAAPVIFLLVSMLYFAPQFSGEKLDMHDVTQYVGASADIERHVEQYGEDPQWTGSSFSGMPSYMIDFKVPAWIIRHASKLPVRAMGEPAVLIFTAMLCFWLMTLLWKVNPWVGIVPALAYGFSTYTILIIGAGHISKVWAMAYIPLLLGAIVYTYRGRHLWFGAALAALAASLEISANHPQITYYFLLVIVALLINELVRSCKCRALPRFWKASGALVLAAALAVGSNFAPLYFTAQHAADTTRGGSELASADTDSASRRGLDLEYATAWSYGRTESFNMFIPNLKGGSSAQPFSQDGPVADVLANFGARSSDLPLGTYWGDQPGTAGPTYLGAVVVFLAVLGLFVLQGSRKWWLLAVSILALFLSWGSNMMWFTELCFRILPGYNKFRAVSTALVIVQWAFPLLACLLLSELWKGEIPAQKMRRGLAWATGITGGIALLFALFGPKMFGFSAPGDYPMLYNIAAYSGFDDADARVFADYVSDAMSAERAKMLRADAWRSLLFVLVSAGLVLLFAKGKMKRGVLTACFAGLVCLDLIPVDLRYLAWDDFVPARRTQLYPTEADKEILKDATPGYRVANLSVSTFSDATTSYFHRSVGGYHGAKLQRYQDLIDRHLNPMHMEVYNMLNTRYFIVPDAAGRLEAQLNPDANGAAWFVGEVTQVDTPDEEIEALNRIDTKRQAVADRRFADMLTVTGTADTAATIRLTDYRANRLTYEYDSASDGIAVFSEIYYDKGWKAFIDGREAPYFRADYVLRAMVLPAGHHTVEFVFRAPKFREASAMTLACSILILAGFAAAAVHAVRDGRRKKSGAADNNDTEQS